VQLYRAPPWSTFFWFVAMRAAIITRPGGPEVLTVRGVSPPNVAAHHVIVRVHASALNRADLLQREGRYPVPAGAPHDIPGLEFAGEVAEVGPEVKRWRTGDRVFGITGGGGNAECLLAHERTLVAIPDALSWTDAAAIPEAFITAHDALVTQANLRSGESVMIHAVGSGVGLAAAQLAHAMGARVYGTARSADKVSRARLYGVEEGLVVSGDLNAITRAVERWTSRRGIAVTLDLVGGPYFEADIAAAALKGRIILIGLVAGNRVTVSLGTLLNKRLTVRGTLLRSRSLEEKIAATEAFARDVLPLLANGVVRPVVDSIFPLSEIREAHAYLESNQTFGKVVLEI
jgi:NADPH:quinone reductase